MTPFSLGVGIALPLESGDEASLLSWGSSHELRCVGADWVKESGRWGQTAACVPTPRNVNLRTSCVLAPSRPLSYRDVLEARLSRDGYRRDHCVSPRLASWSANSSGTRSLFLCLPWEVRGPELSLGCWAREQATPWGRFQGGKVTARAPPSPVAFSLWGFALCIHKYG